MYLEDYLKKKYMEYCYNRNEVIGESAWVNEVLNKSLPRDDHLSYPSVNQWMNGGREPDLKNAIRLINVFGAEIMPVLGINLPADLARLVADWDVLSEETKEEMMALARKDIPEVEVVKP